jgi:hypothetical protein
MENKRIIKVLEKIRNSFPEADKGSAILNITAEWARNIKGGSVDYNNVCVNNLCGDGIANGDCTNSHCFATNPTDVNTACVNNSCGG